MNLLSFAARNLLRRPVRAAVVTLSVGLAVGAALSLVALSVSIERSTSEGMGEHGADMVVVQRDAVDFFSSSIPESSGPLIAALPGVRKVASDLVMFAPIDHRQQKLVFGWPNDSFSWATTPFLAGRAPGPGERHVAVLGAGAAEQLHKGVGDAIDFFDDDYKIIGVADFKSTFNHAAIFVPLRDMQEAAFRAGQVTGFHVLLEPGLSSREIDALSAKIASLGRLYAAPTEDLMRNDRYLAVLRAVSRAVSWIALTMGALSVLNALLMAVQERIREIGVMMAIGWRSGATMALIVLEGAIVGVVGSALGLGFGWAASLLFGSVPMIGEYISFHPTLTVTAPILLGSIALCLLGSLYPAWRATLLSPSAAFRTS
jgi:putative ABC transport system permease protein